MYIIDTDIEHIFGTNIRDFRRLPMDYKIIAVDFDGTLCFSNWPELGEPNTRLIQYLQAQQAAGNKARFLIDLIGRVRLYTPASVKFTGISTSLPQ